MQKFLKKKGTKNEINLVRFHSLMLLNVLQTSFKKKIPVTSSPSYNYEVKKILDKAIENAYRFKTPLLLLRFFF